ncbi:GNAT family N-acetyltransferase [Ilumatobacter sp.]|uniref:GNAT family N-acetyltransferase n=1 Tax=Ilumatobacter sp. TaxID=1967498 RepID=UPI00374FE18C
MAETHPDLEQRLRLHLTEWVGQWPPLADGITVVGDPARLQPTWDGSIRKLLGVGNGRATIIAVPPLQADAVAAALADGPDRAGLGDELGAILGLGAARFGAGVFRSTTTVDPTIEALGEWIATQNSDLPAWLAPFNGPRLVARNDAGEVIASVGIKIHDRYGYELAVVTEAEARGQGFARRLVATAARWVLDDGAIPTYLHESSNLASAHVADAVGFADEGWTVHGLWPHS